MSEERGTWAASATSAWWPGLGAALAARCPRQAYHCQTSLGVAPKAVGLDDKGVGRGQILGLVLGPEPRLGGAEGGDAALGGDPRPGEHRHVPRAAQRFDQIRRELEGRSHGRDGSPGGRPRRDAAHSGSASGSTSGPRSLWMLTSRLLWMRRMMLSNSWRFTSSRFIRAARVAARRASWALARRRAAVARWMW